MINEKGEEAGIIYGWYNTLTDMWHISAVCKGYRKTSGGFIWKYA